MLDAAKEFYFGVATDLPDNGRKKPEQPICAVNDIVYYCVPGVRRGEIATVTAYWRDKDTGRIKVKVQLTRTGEEIETYQTNIRY